MAKLQRILIDTDALVAIIKGNDSNHKKALIISEKIKNAAIFITPLTIPETVTVISYKMSQIEAKEFLIKIRQENFIEISLNPELIQKTDKIFLSQKTKGTSWIDCLNVAVVKTEELDGIFSFDKFYKRLNIKYF